MRWYIDRAGERRSMAVASVRDWQLLVAGPYRQAGGGARSDRLGVFSAMQKIRLAAERGVPVPDGVIFDRAGRPHSGRRSHRTRALGSRS